MVWTIRSIRKKVINAENEAVNILCKIKKLEDNLNGIERLDTYYKSLGLIFDDAENYIAKNAELSYKDINLIFKYLGPYEIENIIKANKKYQNSLDSFKYNPIPIINQQIINLFPNMETIHLYSPNEIGFALNLLKDNPKIKRIIVPSCTYSEYLKYTAQGIKPQDILSVILTAEDISDYLLNPELEKDEHEHERIMNEFKVKYKEGLHSIWYGRYSSNILKEITIPNCITSIASGCFHNIEGITIHIPATVRSVDVDAFDEFDEYNNNKIDIDSHNPYIYFDDEEKNVRNKYI